MVPEILLKIRVTRFYQKMKDQTKYQEFIQRSEKRLNCQDLKKENPYTIYIQHI